MDIDARTRETAATLLGVAYKRTQESSDLLDNRHRAELRVVSTANGTRPTVTGGISEASITGTNSSSHQAHHHHDQYLATTTAPLTTTRTPPPSFPNGTSASQPYQHQHLPPTQHAHVIPPSSAQSAAGSAAVPEQGSSALLSMSSIGFGIDSSPASSWGDATEAAIKALQDAMERSTLRLPIGSNAQNTSTSLQIQVQLGVPAKQAAMSEPMLVDIARVTAILPRGIPVLPIRVTVGGLHIPDSPPVCTAVACITLQTEAAAVAVSSVPEPSQRPTTSNTHAAASSLHTRFLTKQTPESWARLETDHRSESLQAPPPTVSSTSGPPLPVISTQGSSCDPLPNAPSLSRLATNDATPGMITSSITNNSTARDSIQSDTGHQHPIVAAAALAAASKPKNHQSSTSIEMLAIISEEMRLAGDKRSVSAPSLNAATGANHHFPPIAAKKQYHEGIPSALMGPATNALQQPTSLEFHSPYDTNGSYTDGHIERPGSPMSAEEAMLRNAGAYNYKKLPPGVTTKNNRRLFVKHKYRDYSGEVPLPEEQDLIVAGGGTTSAARTPNAAFPLKLHETLSQIEKHGHGDIIGWMPHGRSFRIHMQKEFAEIILPRYFVMTKKSSFLRQLNLYGFNRFSAGPDQGSYYHEKFLRGLKFLCRRMTRQKVNGNRIRSAGNPDDEPVLSRYPVCPPPTVKAGAIGSPAPAAVSDSATVTTPISSPQDTGETSCLQDMSTQRTEIGGDEQDTNNPTSGNDESSQGSDDDASEGGTPNPSFNGAKSSNEPACHQALRQSGDVLVTFPLKLQRMLDKLEAAGQTDAISWLSHGRAFIVRNPDVFVDKLLPLYFNQTKLSSFHKQLQMYNFQRFTTGRDKGAYHHTHFQRGKPHLCMRIQKQENGAGCRKPGNPVTEPNLYSLQPLPAIQSGSIIEVPSGNIGEDDESDGEDQP